MQLIECISLQVCQMGIVFILSPIAITAYIFSKRANVQFDNDSQFLIKQQSNSKHQMDAAIPIALLGLSTSGKTAIVRSAINNQNQIFPTCGLEITYLNTTSKLILAYDCSGEGSSRNNWQLIAGLADCVVYVLDAHNTDTFATAKKTLFDFLERNKFMKKKNLCIMLNKCDFKNRPSKELLVKALDVEKLAKLVGKYYIKETSSYNKEGLDECFEWIIKNYTQAAQDS